VAKGPALHLSLVMIAFPAIIAVGAAAEVGPKLGRLCSLLGELSFPVYILQAPLLRVGAEVLKHLHLRPSGEVWFSIIEVISVCAVAWAAVKFFDQPLQRMFRTRLSGRAEGAPPQDRERALDLAP
jgi:peptidoglycan/LPS O-acetylase OafA/YrhL